MIKVAKIKPHAYLRYVMAAQGLTCEELAVKLGCHRNTVYLKLNGQIPFKLAEVYAIMRILKITFDEIPRVFPPKDQTK